MCVCSTRVSWSSNTVWSFALILASLCWTEPNAVLPVWVNYCSATRRRRCAPTDTCSSWAAAVRRGAKVRDAAPQTPDCSLSVKWRVCLCPTLDKSNLLVCRNQTSDTHLSPSEFKHVNQMIFHKIHKEDLETVSLNTHSHTHGLMIITKIRITIKAGFAVDCILWKLRNRIECGILV